MNTLPVENLELRAMEQRTRIHKTADELKNKVVAAREKYDVTNLSREHFVGASVFISLLGFIAGYSMTGIFTDH